jgi:hypothetical protein
MDQQVLWFEWKSETPIDIEKVYDAVVDGGMGLQAMRLMGSFEFGDGWAQLAGGLSPRFEYGGKNPISGEWDIEVIGYNDDGAPTVYSIQPLKRPEVYQQ